MVINTNISKCEKISKENYNKSRAAQADETIKEG
jgi:hypothetical protein